MSTLTSTPSPAASPRALYPSHYIAPRLSSYSSPSARARPPPPASAPAPASSPRLPRTPASQPHTTDAGTQYTPPGLPPTASHTVPGKRKDTSNLVSMGPPPTGDIPLAPTHPGTPTDQKNGEATPANLPTHPVATAPNPEVSPSPSKRQRTANKVKTMPLKYETCNPKDLGYIISAMLMELIRLNDELPLNGRLTRFHSRAPPGISCHDYLQRLIQHATLSPPILLSMVYYIDRLCAMYPAFNVSSLTVHRFLITAATVAAKGLSDSFWTNPTYARIGGITTGELATLEMEFLQKVQWRIVPKPEVLVDYYMSLVQRSDLYELESAPSSSNVTPEPAIVPNTDMEMDPP